MIQMININVDHSYLAFVVYLKNAKLTICNEIGKIGRERKKSCGEENNAQHTKTYENYVWKKLNILETKLNWDNSAAISYDKITNGMSKMKLKKKFNDCLETNNYKQNGKN